MEVTVQEEETDSRQGALQTMKSTTGPGGCSVKVSGYEAVVGAGSEGSMGVSRGQEGVPEG